MGTFISYEVVSNYENYILESYDVTIFDEYCLDRVNCHANVKFKLYSPKTISINEFSVIKPILRNYVGNYIA